MSATIPQLPPLPPTGLSKDAVRKWHELLPRLARLNLTAPEHYDTLGLYCDAFDAWLLARTKLDDLGCTVENRAGTFASPWVAIRDAAHARMLDAANRIGLNGDNQFAVRLPSFAEWSDGIVLDGDDDELPEEVLDSKFDGPDAYVTVGADGSVQVLE